MFCLIYDLETGTVTEKWCISDTLVPQPPMPGTGVEEVVQDLYFNANNAFYFKPLGRVVQKPVIPVTADKTTVSADGIDQVVFTLPATCPNGTPLTVSIDADGEKFTAAGTIAFDFVEPGEYVFTFSGRNYLDKTLTITAV